MDSICRQCRREGIKLFLKGERCFTPKCAFTRRSYGPGRTDKTRLSKPSDYALQLREKQKARTIYGLGERQFKNYFLQAARSAEDTSLKLFELLERRIDNTIFRAGLAPSRAAARQLCSHKKVKLNGRKINIPSILVKPQDKIQVALPKNLKSAKIKLPTWLKVDKTENIIEIKGQPQVLAQDLNLNAQLIVEYYSR